MKLEQPSPSIPPSTLVIHPLQACLQTWLRTSIVVVTESCTENGHAINKMLGNLNSRPVPVAGLKKQNKKRVT